MNNFPLLLGNVCSLLAMGSDAISAKQKTPRGILLVQCVSQVFYIIGAVVLKGYSGAVQNAVSIVRNLAAAFKVGGKVLEWASVVAGVVLGAVFNNRGFLGWLPIVANLQYSLVVFRCGDNGRMLKISFLVAVALFAFFNGVILNFVGVAANLVVLAMTGYELWKTRKKKQ